METNEYFNVTTAVSAEEMEIYRQKRIVQAQKEYDYAVSNLFTVEICENKAEWIEYFKGLSYDKLFSYFYGESLQRLIAEREEGGY